MINFKKKEILLKINMLMINMDFKIKWNLKINHELLYLKRKILVANISILRES